jgi:hypothetical protein
MNTLKKIIIEQNLKKEVLKSLLKYKNKHTQRLEVTDKMGAS